MTPLAWSWRDLALCRQVVTADYDPFFSDDPEDQDDALALCEVCPAQGACLAYAIRTAQPHGIWGGRPQAELQRLIARDRDGRPRRALIAAPEHHNAAKTRCRRVTHLMRPTPTTTLLASGAAALVCVRPGAAGRPSVAHRPTARRRGWSRCLSPPSYRPTLPSPDLHAHASS